MAKILVAEDEPDIQDMMIFMLRREGYEVVAAADGEEAYRVAQAESPDLILMDLRMPHLDGYEATRLIKSNPALAHVPIIFVSVRSKTDGPARLEWDSGFVNKPFAPVEMMHRVKETLARKQAGA